jgi:hypothetical protein
MRTIPASAGSSSEAMRAATSSSIVGLGAVIPDVEEDALIVARYFLVVNGKTGIAATNDPVTGLICAAHQHARTFDNDALVVNVAQGSKDLLVESGLCQPTLVRVIGRR